MPGQTKTLSIKYLLNGELIEKSILSDSGDEITLPEMRKEEDEVMKPAEPAPVIAPEPQTIVK